ncbi:hypothetical protein [Nocardioides lacusdianchii]|uniref:hypothetical protein n=1 Tax=Nocardioides lacusdianchii TaxID=2783664 RepID=UPI001CCEA5D0|nr:hypothetical protein [Nocardioides lacusdianchii]
MTTTRRTAIALFLSLGLGLGLTPAPLVYASAVSSAVEVVHPWLPYFPDEGVVCTRKMYREFGSNKVYKTVVVSKSRKRVVSRSTLDGERGVASLLPQGAIGTSGSSTQRRNGWVIRLEFSSRVPSPHRLKRFQAGSAQIVGSFTVPPRFRPALVRGTTFGMRVDYRHVGLGTKGLLLDDDATEVRALGYRTELASIRFTNVKPRYAGMLRRELRREFTSGVTGTTWVSEGLGMVRSSTTDEDGYSETTWLVGCE